MKITDLHTPLPRGSVRENAADFNRALTRLAASFRGMSRRVALWLCLFAALASPPALRAQELDTTFANPNLNGGFVNALAVDDNNGRIVVGGAFTTAGSGNSTYGRLARFYADGILDNTFANPNLSSFALAVAKARNGKIVVGGAFVFAGSGSSSPYYRLARLYPDGMPDTTFTNPNLNGPVSALAVDGSSDKIVAGGAFVLAGSGSSLYRRLARFNWDGGLDTTFADPNLNGQVNALTVDGSGRIVVGGAFTTAGSGNSTYGRLARFNPNGTLDTTFANPNLNAEVNALAVDGSGKILVGGSFTTAGSGNSSYNGLARFNANGTLDTVFVNPNLNAQVNALVLDGSGKIVVGGAFTTAGIGNSNYAGVARFNTNTPVIISAQPQTQFTAVTSNVTFSVTASGGTGLTYQWQFNGTNIVGATSPTFSLANISATNGGAYRVVVSNDTGGTTTSQAANLLLFGDLRFLAVSVLSGTVGQQFRVDYADVLNSVTNWLPLTTVTLPFSPFYVVDPNSQGRTNRYYRAVSLP